MTKEEFFAKVDWEGGYYELARYGLKAESLDDPELAKLWKTFLEHYGKCATIEDALNGINEDMGGW